MFYKIQNCDINACNGMSCYDGVYLKNGEEEYLKKIINEYKDYFSFLPENFIVYGNWKYIIKGRKTAVKTVDDLPKDHLITLKKHYVFLQKVMANVPSKV